MCRKCNSVSLSKAGHCRHIYIECTYIKVITQSGDAEEAETQWRASVSRCEQECFAFNHVLFTVSHGDQRQINTLHCPIPQNSLFNFEADRLKNCPLAFKPKHAICYTMNTAAEFFLCNSSQLSAVQQQYLTGLSLNEKNHYASCALVGC